MGSPVVLSFVFLVLLPLFTQSAPISTEFIRPNFTASNFHFIDHSGTFLASPNSVFIAAITNTHPESPSFYFSVLHALSNTIIWSANRNSPVSDSAKLLLSLSGLSLSHVWSTPTDRFHSPVSLLQLQDNGNLLLLDHANRSLWESFDYPTDTIVAGQRLPVGHSLVGALSEDDLSGGDYRFTVSPNDAVLLWNGFVYWKLSMDLKANTVSNLGGSYLQLNDTGLYLLGGGGPNGSVIVIQLVLDLLWSSSSPSDSTRFAKLEPNGRFAVRSFQKEEEFRAPADDCRIPAICGRIGLCSTGKCSCPPGFRSKSSVNDCVPADSSFSLPSPSCENDSKMMLYTYMKLGSGMDYFSNDFTQPVIDHGAGLSDCEDLCNNNCTCLGIFHDQSEGSCYLLENQLGSIMSASDDKTGRIGYIKALLATSKAKSMEKKRHFPVLGMVLLPLSGFLLVLSVAVIGAICYRNKKQSIAWRRKLGPRRNSSSSAELDIVIPGLPVRFDYDDLVEATENFNQQIGSGGFGVVYKGTLKDKTVVAVKKITSLGVQGKREFCTEIAVIGNIHHVNLVRLKGYCAYGRQRFLVYEYMSRGSLDRILFGGSGPVLEWQERYEIALATARGLAYLHSGCDHKIIHCDVKPENILLDNHMHVKISDFGLSKLLTPEQSGLFTTMRGTRGYLAPEWLSNSAITDKSDVYSYGMVLLEIVRGKKNSYSSSHQTHTTNASSGGHTSSSSNSENNSVYFPLFALEMHEQKRYLELADSRLDGRFGRVTSEEVEKLVRVALCCVHEEPTRRPSMSNVVSMLEGGLPLGEPRVESLNFLRFLGRRFAEASTIGRGGEQSEFAVHPLAIPTSSHSSSSGSQNYSHMSSQDVSGPR